MSGARQRYAIVGVGARSRMFQDAIAGPYARSAELVAFCDSNPARLAHAKERVRVAGAAPRTYADTAFAQMLAETRPDALIVATPDATHDHYITQALAAGLDVVTEKPMTTTAAKAQRVLDACRGAGKHIRVAFNYRYSPPTTQLKHLLMAGAIGAPHAVAFTWLLDTSHGADYFRRWHATKANSGGLAVHKATHHFDLVNWWLSAVPVSVQASGQRAFFTPQTARRMGLTGAHERCGTCSEAARCAFFYDVAANETFKAMYAQGGEYDGYFRDRCVWRDDIDIEDTIDAIVRYDTGATLSYSLRAGAAWEGFHVAFDGPKGRLEHTFAEQSYDAAGAVVHGGHTTILYPLRGPAQTIEPWAAGGPHGGGDTRLLEDLFAPEPAADPYKRAADERAGAYAMLVGAAANQCFETGETVRVASLVRNLDRPDFTPMPSPDDAAPMPPRTNWIP